MEKNCEKKILLGTSILSMVGSMEVSASMPSVFDRYIDSLSKDRLIAFRDLLSNQLTTVQTALDNRGIQTDTATMESGLLQVLTLDQSAVIKGQIDVNMELLAAYRVKRLIQDNVVNGKLIVDGFAIQGIDSYFLTASLSEDPRIHSIRLVGAIDDEETRTIASAIMSNNSIIGIELYGNTIGKSGVIALANVLKGNRSSIKRLELYATGDDVLFPELAQALAENTSITSITLSHQKLDEAYTIINALKGNTSITHLSLNYIDLEDEGAKVLADILKGNTSITNIILEQNNIGDDGASALAETLKGNTQNTNINLVCNHIGKVGFKAFNEALRTRTFDSRAGLFRGTISLYGNEKIGKTLRGELNRFVQRDGMHLVF